MSTQERRLVRPISFAEIEALAQPDAGPRQAYLRTGTKAYGIVLTPCVLTPNPRRSKGARDGIPHSPVFAAMSDPRGRNGYAADTGQQIGHRVRVKYRTLFGQESEGDFCTSQECETALNRLDTLYHGAADFRLRVMVDAEESDEGATEEPLMPVFGSQGTVGLIVPDMDPEEVMEKARAALEAALPGVKLHKVLARPVKDVRVNVYEISTPGSYGKPLALNVLDAEVTYLGFGNVSVDEADPNMVVGS